MRFKEMESMDQLGLLPYGGGSILKWVDGDLIVSNEGCVRRAASRWSASAGTQNLGFAPDCSSCVGCPFGNRGKGFCCISGEIPAASSARCDEQRRCERASGEQIGGRRL